MKRTFYPIIISLYCFACLNGQDYSAMLVGNIHGDYYIWETKSHKFKLYHSLVKSGPDAEILVRTDPGAALLKNERTEQIILLGDRIVLITSRYKKITDKQSLYYRFIDQATMVPEKEQHILTEPPPPENISTLSGTYTFSVSPDRTRLMVVREFAPNVFKARPKIFEISVFDEDLNLIWDKKETLTVTDKQLKPQSYLVDSAGDVVIMGRAKYDKDTVDTKLLRNFALLEYTENGQR